jgi:hypothetical protein
MKARAAAKVFPRAEIGRLFTGLGTDYKGRLGPLGADPLFHLKSEK